ncbi:LysE family transporter [Roseomonas aerophila]|uniref:LysE family transporter n=1 Tax=Teichococcus aerophilus TaxID=1224513 RepID=A0ABR7RQT4_9PROT|nr:LysE family transporter [Pseudoroseomonas aerophila]MBC9208949.1 LysE family transporter [Pseudoroseomonas aerophila]
MLALFTYAFALALALCLSPGPVFAESLRRGLRGGFRPALIVQFGSLVGDLAWALAASAGLGLIFSVPALRLPLEFAGAAFLLWLAWSSLRTANSFPSLGVVAPEERIGPFLSGALLSLTNPKNIPFWLAVGATMGGLGVSTPVSARGAVFLAGFMAACVACCFVAAGAIAWLHRHLTPRLFFGINVLTGLALAALAINSITMALASML